MNKAAVRTGSNLPKVKARNLSIVLDALRKLQPISRTDLAAATSLTPATMTNLVSELSEFGLVAETPSESRQVGRRPSLLTFNPAAGTAIGIEISRTHLRVLATDLGGRVLERVERANPGSAGPERALRTLGPVLHRMIEAHRPVGVGVGVPGPVDSAAGLVLEPPNFPGWQGFPLAERLRALLGLPVWLDDDAKTAALGERAFGAGQGVGNLLYVSIGTGIGAGLIVRNKLYRGTHDLAGEIGHTTLDLDGPLCECGNRGCLETLVSIPAILRAAKGAFESVSDIQSRALKRDPEALKAKERAYRYLAAGVGNAVNFYDPDLIVLGGALVGLWPELCDEIASRVRGRSFGLASGGVRIVPATLGGDSSALGAASMVIEQVIELPSLLGLDLNGSSARSGSVWLGSGERV